jgi:hypothetical protein
MNEDMLHADVPIATLRLSDETVAGLRALADWIEEHPQHAAHILPGSLTGIAMVVPAEDLADDHLRVERMQDVAHSAEQQVSARWNYREERSDPRGTWVDVAFSKTVGLRVQVLPEHKPVKDTSFDAYDRVMRAGGSYQEASAVMDAVRTKFDAEFREGLVRR